MDQAAKIINGLAGFAWPIVALVILAFARNHVSEIVAAILKKFNSSTDIEVGSIKLKGAIVSTKGDVIRQDTDNIRIVDATPQDVDHRKSVYENSRSLVLVHTIKPSEPEEYSNNPRLRIFDVSIFLHSHLNRGRFNDIKSVTYFLGDKWGKGKFGSKFVVDTGNHAFAMTAKMYGSCICVATVQFHDGTEAVLTRYLDVEMAPLYGIPLREARIGA